MSRIFFSLLFIGFVLVSAYVSYNTPQYDWDMLPYSAIYYQSNGWSDARTHDYIYDTLVPSLPPGTRAFLEDKPSEVASANNIYFFSQQVPFYTPKPGYNFLIRLITPHTSSPVEAMTLISVLCYILLCFVIWFWLKKYLDHIWACLASLFISALPLVIEQGRLFTPDPLSTLLVLSALFLLYEKKYQLLSFLLLLLSLMVRQDNIIVILLIAGFALYRSYTYMNKINIPAIALVLLSVIIYFTVSAVFHPYGWKIFFMRSVIDQNVSAAMWDKTPMTFALYFKYLGIGFLTFKMRWIYSSFLFFLTYFSIKRAALHQKILLEIMAVLSALMLIKFFILPFFSDRYFSIEYIFAMMAICIAIFPKRNFAAVPSQA